MRPLARIRISSAGDPIDVIDVQPSARTFHLTVVQDGKRKNVQAQVLTDAIDVETGEVLEEPVAYFRAIWARQVCGPAKQWPLPDLINGLSVNGLGPRYAQRIAAAMTTWERFAQAVEQLREIELPSSRDDVDYLRFGAAIEQGLANTSTAEHHINVGAENITFRTHVSQMPSGVPLPEAYPQPLATLMNNTGPAMWRSLREWADSPASGVDVAELLRFGTPAPYQRPSRQGLLAGLVFVFTGTLESMTREEACRAIERLGGKVQGSVSERTSVVVAGAGADGGSKLRRASKLDIDVWTEAEFLSEIASRPDQ